ncbi:MAG: hypothetical protein KDE31_05675, partial [Caldilineaceae bacterium]|nr:hypothetical protein [Caldilineaceae bacterium]
SSERIDLIHFTVGWRTMLPPINITTAVPSIKCGFSTPQLSNLLTCSHLENVTCSLLISPTFQSAQRKKEQTVVDRAAHIMESL